jgi:hypothetical protein
MIDEAEHRSGRARVSGGGSVSAVGSKGAKGTARVSGGGEITATGVAASAAGAALIYSGVRTMIGPPTPEPGLHPHHDAGDLVIGGVQVLLGVGMIAYFGGRILLRRTPFR